MELWDAYDREGNKLAKTLIRGEKIPSGVYHLVCGILVQHTDGEYLLMRRAYDKPGWPGVFEASAGGAVQQGEDSLTAAKRELLEETGIAAGQFSPLYVEIGRSGIYHGYLCVTDWPKDQITLQAGETVEYRWVTAEQLKAMMEIRPFQVVVQRGVKAYLDGAKPPVRIENTPVDTATLTLESVSVEACKGAHRPAWKLAPQANWMNDPNGLIYFRGRYHAFWQCYPYAPEWHHMHWAHGVSDDLIHWEYLPVALAPDQPYEDDFGGGCFSGSAIEKDGRLYLIYTAYANRRQTQCVAWSDDGIHFEKYEGNPVIAYAPEGHDPVEFRDPRVFEVNGTYYLVVGSCIGTWGTGEGCAVMYRSQDLLHWTYMGVCARGGKQFGTMWECPDLFPVDGRWVMTFSPQKMEGARTCWLCGEMDFEKGMLNWTEHGTLDHGWDYYAAQTFQNTPGRRVQLGWQNSWDSRVGDTTAEKWRWSMALARELSLGSDQRLRIRPAAEAMRQPEDEGNVYFRRVEIRSGKATLWPRGRIGQNVYIRVDLPARMLEIGRELGDTWEKKCWPLAEAQQEILLFADRNAVEAYADDGRLAMSCVDLSAGEGLKVETEEADVTITR